MTLLWLILVPIAAGFLALPSGRHARWISLAAVIADFFLALSIWFRGPRVTGLFGPWLEQLDWNWIPSFGIHFHLAADGLSLLLVMLTFFLGIVAVLASWSEARANDGFFYLNLMWVLAGITGVFLAFDLFLFYFAWELMLVPMYFLLAVWGSGRRTAAAVKFFLFTQLSGLLMLISILALYFVHLRTTG
ncbi:MAG: NADH-quinone oxidoreductase subunit M, partial [Acidobacteria bacterium]|nr:NADH-quinone oxidoreductase subunit M [Acidobacteriota bacterium]